jgi:branched-chain amino acid aminotransferase
MDKECTYAYKNGVHIPSYASTIPTRCQAVQYGLGVFEGIRVYNTKKGPAIFRLRCHVKRLFRSAEKLGMEMRFSFEDVMSMIELAVKENEINEGYIRPFVGFTERTIGLDTKPEEVTLYIDMFGKSPYKKDVLNVKISDMIRPHPMSFDMGAKSSGTYINSFLNRSKAKKQGFDDAIMFDYRGFLAEASVANIFVVDENDTLLTPKPSSILDGITRSTIFHICRDVGLKVEEKDLSILHLLTAKEVFICGTAAEIIPVVSIDLSETFNLRAVGLIKHAFNEAVIYNHGNIGDITKMLKRKYLNIVHGRNKEFEHMLHFV